MDNDYNLWVLLHQTADAMLRVRQNELNKFDVSTVEVSVLEVLFSSKQGVTPAEISRRIFREPHTVSALLRRMQKKGLLMKTKDLERKNMVRVSIREKGLAVYTETAERESIHKMMFVLSEKECQHLQFLLRTLRLEAFEELAVKIEPPPLPEY